MSGTARHVLLFIIFQGAINSEVFAGEKDSIFSRSAYFATEENKRLMSHVVERFQAPSLLSCIHICMRNAWCTSTNFKAASEMDVTGNCELNKHSYSSVNENTNFHEEEGVTFSVFLKVKSPGIFF